MANDIKAKISIDDELVRVIKKLMEEIKILKVENKKLKQEKQKFNVAMLDIGKRYKNKD